MASAENIAGAEVGNQVVGKVVVLYGNVKAITIDGTERALGPNSSIFAYDRIITESDGRVSIIMDDPAQSQIDIGRMSHIIIDEDIFAGVTAEEVAAAAAEVEQIQEALLAEGFDPTVELEAPAAGGASAAGGGHPVPDFARVTHEGEITSGAETIGTTGDTVEPIPGAAEPPDPAVTVAINAEGGLVPEGEDAVFTVTITNASDGAQLNFGLHDGTALVESDYNLTTFQYDDGSGWQDISGPITLSAGTSTLLVRTDTVADTIDEPDENFSLSAEIVNENGASASGSAEAIIVDGDAPTVTVSDDIRVEGDTEVFTVSVTKAAEGAELTLNLNDGSAEAPADYNATTFEYSTDDGDTWQDINGPITLTEGNQEILVRTDTAVDDLLEGDENFFLHAELSNAGGDPVADSGEGIIVEGTPGPEPDPDPVTLNVSDDLIPEGDDGVFTVTIGDAPEGAQLNLGLSEGSADDPQDYHAVKFEYNDGSGWKPVTGPIDIPAGDSSLQVRTDTVDDTIDENNETFFVDATISDNVGTIIADTGTGVIQDNDVPPPPPSPVVSIAADQPGGVTEGNTLTFTVTQNIISTENTSVSVNLSPGTADAGADYTDGSPYTVTILAGQTTATLTVDVPTVDDELNENTESFTANITNVSNVNGASIGIGSAIGEILDNDGPELPQVHINVAEADAGGVTEGNTIHFVVTQDAVSDSDTEVMVNLSPGTADAGDDYTDGSPYTVTILAGQTTATLTVDVPTVDDDLDEASPEDFTAAISSATNATGVTFDPTPATGEILDNDATPEVSIALADEDVGGVTEGGTINFVVSQDVKSDSDTEVTVNLSPGTADAGDDYTDGSPYTVTILAGQTTATLTVDVPTVDDDLDEPSPEDFTAAITSATNATGVNFDPTPATGEILDNEATPEVSIALADEDVGGVTEGGTINFVVSQDVKSDSDTEVTVNLSPGTADAGDDYTDGSPYTVTILAGQTTATLTVDVPTVDDDLDEPSPEDFTAAITNATNATGVTFDPTPATGEILDNEATPEVSIALADEDVGGVTEGGTINFVVSQDVKSDSDTEVTVNLSPGTADAGDDYTDGSPYTVTILAGQTTATLTVDVPTVDDDLDEPSPEDFTAAITSATNATGVTFDPTPATGEILDNEATPEVSIALADEDVGGVTEGGTINFVVSQDVKSDSDTEVTVNLSPGTADAGDDYTDGSPYTVTILAGQTTATLTVDVPTVDDDLDEPSPEDFTAAITSATNATGVTFDPTPATGEILDNEATPEVSIALADEDVGGVTEGGTINFVVSQDVKSDSDTEVTVNLSPGTADADDDYTDGSPYTVTILAGQTTANLTVDVPTVDDELIENTENFTAAITNATNATGVTFNPTPATGLILDNDSPFPEVSIALADEDVGGVTEGGTINFVVSQDAVSDSDTEVTVNLSPGTADAGDDYTDGSPYTVTILAGQTTATLTVDVPTVDDDLDEPSPEDFTAAITNATNATGVTFDPTPATGEILDNEATPEVSIALADEDVGGVTEGGTINFVVSQDVKSDSDTEVTVNLSPGTADAGDDYTDGSPYTVTILAGQTTATLTVDVPTVDDDLDEPSPEDFTAAITNATNATGVTFDPTPATGEILDNEATPEVSIALADEDVGGVTEGGTINFVVSQDVKSDSDTEVTVNLSPGTADAGDDYTDGSPYTVTILAGQTTATLTVDVPTVDDDLDEPSPEDFTAAITSATNATGVTFDPTPATGEILDNEATPEVSIALADEDVGGVTEGGTINFVVSQDVKSDSDTEVTVNLSPGTADAGDDYTDGSPYTVTILAGQTTATLTVDVPTVDDDLDEPSPEDFTAAITSATNATGVTFDPTPATGEILDNDAEPTFTVSDDSVNEGEFAVFDITLSNASSESITLDLSTIAGTATAGADYDDTTIEVWNGSAWVSSTSVTFAPGETSAQARVLTLNDAVTEEPDETFTLQADLASGSTANSTAAGLGTIIDITPPFILPTASLVTNSNVTEQSITLIIYKNNDGADPTELLQPTAILRPGTGQETSVEFDLDGLVLDPANSYTFLLKYDDPSLGTKVQVDEFILENDGEGGPITLVGNPNSPEGPLLGADHDVTIGPEGAPGNPAEGMLFILEGDTTSFTITEGITYDIDGTTLVLENVHHANDGFNIDVSELPLDDMNAIGNVSTIDIDNNDPDSLTISDEDVDGLADNTDNDIAIIADNNDTVNLVDSTNATDWTEDPGDAGVYNWDENGTPEDSDPSLDLDTLVPEGDVDLT